LNSGGRKKEKKRGGLSVRGEVPKTTKDTALSTSTQGETKIGECGESRRR